MLSLSAIAYYWNGNSDAKALADAIPTVVKLKLGGCSERILKEDCALVVSAADILKTFEDYKAGCFSKEQVAYLFDCLLLSEEVVIATEAVKEVVEEMSDFEITGDLTQEKVEQLIQILKKGEPG